MSEKQGFKKDPMSPTGLMQAGSFHIWQMPGGHGSITDAVRPPLSPRGPAKSIRLAPNQVVPDPKDVKIPPFIPRKPLYPFPNQQALLHKGNLANVFAKMGSVLSDEQKDLIKSGHGVTVWACGHTNRCRCKQAHELPPRFSSEVCYDCQQDKDASINVNRDPGFLAAKHAAKRGIEKRAVGATTRRLAQLLKATGGSNALSSLTGWRKSLPEAKALIRSYRDSGWLDNILGEHRTAKLGPANKGRRPYKPSDIFAPGISVPSASPRRSALDKYPQLMAKMLDRAARSTLIGNTNNLDGTFGQAINNFERNNRARLNRLQSLYNDQADNLAMSGRHTKKILPHADPDTLPSPTAGSDYVLGNIKPVASQKTILDRLLMRAPSNITYGPGETPENLYKGLKGGPKLNLQNMPDDAQWFSGLQQVAQRPSYAASHLWKVPVNEVPKTWKWNRIFTPHVADNFSQKSPQELVETYGKRKQFGFGRAPGLDEHPLYETVPRIPSTQTDAPLQVGELYKKLPSGRAFQMLKKSPPPPQELT